METIRALLIEHRLFKEIVDGEGWHYDLPQAANNVVINDLTYSSQTVQKDSLLFCKGLNFKPAYLSDALAQGLPVYISERVYEEVTTGIGFIVTDVHKAMALISMAFYNYPQNQLTIIGYTGTKGKTTAAYFCYEILARSTKNKTALLSTMETILDGQTAVKSLLTTPESLDLYRMMASAVSNGMTHLVMEVSSQAFKQERVYNLTFDVGIFLNISPDHIGTIEHPDFDDYFYCKRRLLMNSRKLIINSETDYYPLVLGTSQAYTSDLLTYAQSSEQSDYAFTSLPDGRFQVSGANDYLKVSGTYQIKLPGDFNQGNALSAILATRLAGADLASIQAGLAVAKVPGRMERFTTPANQAVYIDYAHNRLSLQTLLSYIKSAHPAGRLFVVIGSTGDKGLSRRLDFSQVLSEYADVVILTTDDPGSEDPNAIAAEIGAQIVGKVEIHTILEREEAIRQAFALSQPADVLAIVGKGADQYQLINAERIPYKGDVQITKELIGSGE